MRSPARRGGSLAAARPGAGVVLAGLLGASVAGAIDGVIEIHSAPFTVSQPGSYRLTRNLDLSAASVSTSAITVASDDVTIDLGGFTIQGPVTCTGSPVSSCSATGSGRGIAASTHTNIVVTHGVVRGFGNAGVDVGGNSRVEDVHVSHNGSSGIVAGNSLAGGSIVRGCTASSNGIAGISGGPNSLIEGNTARDNKFDGIAGRNDSTIRDNLARHNGTDGIDVMEGSVVAGNSAYDNGSDGIEAGADTVITRNTARTNTGFGLNGLSSSAYVDNVFSDNDLAAADDLQVSGGLQIGSNVCRAAQHPSNRCP